MEPAETKTPVRRLCLGGSFNPIHHGHLICGRAAAEAAGFDRVVLIPSARPPLKPDSADMASGEDRLVMCQLAVTNAAKWYEVEPLELARPGLSYTLDTARELAGRGWREVTWLIGTDTLPQLDRWHGYRDLLREADFLVMARPGAVVDWDALPPEVRPLRDRLVEVPRIEISATEIRRRVAAGLPIEFLTPEAVCRYIRERGLYRGG